MTACRRSPPPFSRSRSLPPEVTWSSPLQRERQLLVDLADSLLGGLLSERRAPSVPAGRMSRQNRSALTQARSRKSKGTFRDNGAASPRRELRPLRASLARVMKGVVDQAGQSPAHFLEPVSMRNKRPIDFGLQGAEGGWLRALFPSLVLFKK